MDHKERELERLQKERAYKEKMQREQLHKARLQTQQQYKEQLQREQLQRKQLHREQMQKEYLRKERLLKEQLRREQVEKEQRERERLRLETMQKERERKKRQRRLFVKTLFITLGICAALVLVAYGIFTYLLSDMERKDVDETQLSVNEELPKVSGITNIALFGLDSRQNAYEGRSDAIMVASVNHDTGKVKLVSVARDTYVDIPGHGGDKINHAYAYGGAELAIQTLNENFGMDITDYVSVNFDSLAVVIDAMGGIDLEVSELERQQINAYLLAGEPLWETGMVHLTGPQAVSYARIRKIDGDDMRTQRQRNVLACLFEKAKTIRMTEYPVYVKRFSSLVETSLSNQEILRLASIGMNKGLGMELGAFPNEALPGQGKYIGERWYYVYDLEQAAEMLHAFIYDDIPFDRYGEDAYGTEETEDMDFYDAEDAV